MAINPTTLKALIDTQITNETVNFAITPTEVGERIKDTVDYTTEQILNISLLQGPQGLTGTNGSTGPTGNNGTNGSQGYQGFNGPQGFQGFNGPQGFQGLTGSVGITGPQGTTGAAPILTIGDVEATSSAYPTLTYDINKVFNTLASQRVLLPGGAEIGKVVIVYSYNTTYSFQVRTAVGDPLTGISIGGIQQGVDRVTVLNAENYKFTALGEGNWKAEAVGPTLQQVYNSGNTITGNSGTQVNTISYNTITLSNSTSGFSSTLAVSGLNKYDGSGNSHILQFPATISGVQTTALPNVTGTIAVREKTIGILIDADLSPVSPRTPLPYDINDMRASAYNAVALPIANLYIGKQVIIRTNSGHLNLQAHPDFGNVNYWILYSNGMSGTNILLGPNSQYRFTYSGPDLSGLNIWYIEFMSNQLTVNNFLLPYGNQLILLVADATTTALSLSQLNSTYTYNYPIGLQVVCKDIVGGGLTYTRTGSNTWVSHSITTVV
jgi:hypothetical protein